MKSPGIVRKIDDLGRIVIPMEIRKKFDINITDAMEIFTQDDNIILRKWEKSCIICDSQNNLKKIKEKMICETCINNINNMIYINEVK